MPPVPWKADPQACVVPLQGQFMWCHNIELKELVAVARLWANKGARLTANLVWFLKAGQTAQVSAYYSASLSSSLDDAQDWELMANQKVHGKYPDMVKRSWQQLDIVVHLVHVDQVDSPIQIKNERTGYVQWLSTKVWPLI